MITEELDKKLCRDFPRIFVERKLSPMQSAMARGFECGDGWYDIIHDLCTRIQEHCDKNPNVEQVQARQVKEKFGGLRFYVKGGDKSVVKMIMDTENESYRTCEKCGSKVRVSCNVTANGWISSLCQKCSNPQECFIRGYN